MTSKPRVDRPRRFQSLARIGPCRTFLLDELPIMKHRCYIAAQQVEFRRLLNTDRIEGTMRIGTWNLENRLMTDKHRKLLLDQECDVWLLTEVNRSWADEAGTKILHFNSHLSEGVMGRNQHWSAILSILPLTPLDAPHAASAAAIVNGVTERRFQCNLE